MAGKNRLVVMAMIVASIWTAGARSSYAIFDWLCGSCASKSTAVTTYAPPFRGTTFVAAPAAAPTVCSYMPQTCYQTVQRVVPVTTCRPITTCDPCTGCPVTTFRPVTMYAYRPQVVPMTSYRMVCAPCAPMCAPVCAPACAPACAPCSGALPAPVLGAAAPAGCPTCQTAAPVLTPGTAIAPAPSILAQPGVPMGTPSTQPGVLPGPATQAPSTQPGGAAPRTFVPGAPTTAPGTPSAAPTGARPTSAIVPSPMAPAPAAPTGGTTFFPRTNQLRTFPPTSNVVPMGSVQPLPQPSPQPPQPQPSSGRTASRLIVPATYTRPAATAPLDFGGWQPAE